MAKYNVKGQPWRFPGAVNVEDCITSKDVMIKAHLDFKVDKCQLVAKMPFDTDKVNLLKQLVKCGIVELKPKVDKTRIKNYIKETGAMFNVAKLTENQSLSIK